MTNHVNLFIQFVLSIWIACTLPHETASSHPRLVPRVVGGIPILNRCRDPYNWMAALQFNATFSPITFCSAVMITDTYLLTTAKCLFTIAEQKSIATAVVGERDTIMRGEYGEQYIPINSFKIHFFYNQTNRANDIGLIQLKTPAMLSHCVKPVHRMEKDDNACEDADDTCQMVGWGSYSETVSPTNSRLPRAAPVTVYNDLITTLLSSASLDQPPIGTIYGKASNPYQKACFFDWGGVVSCRRNGNNVLRGIISDHNCNSQTSLPFLLLDVPYYQSWIDRCIKDWGTCHDLSAASSSTGRRR